MKMKPEDEKEAKNLVRRVALAMNKNSPDKMKAIVIMYLDDDADDELHAVVSSPGSTTQTTAKILTQAGCLLMGIDVNKLDDADPADWWKSE